MPGVAVWGSESEDSWMLLGVCREVDPELWFSTSGSPREILGRTTHALQICDRCPVKQRCAEYAITNQIEWGIWGGLTEDDRYPDSRAARQRRWRAAKKEAG